MSRFVLCQTSPLWSAYNVLSWLFPFTPSELCLLVHILGSVINVRVSRSLLEVHSGQGFA